MLKLEAAAKLGVVEERAVTFHRSLAAELVLAVPVQRLGQAFDHRGGGRQRELDERGRSAARHRSHERVDCGLRVALEALGRGRAANEPGMLPEPHEHRRRDGGARLAAHGHVGVGDPQRRLQARGAAGLAGDRQPH